MNTVLACLGVAVLLPYVLAFVGTHHKAKQFGKVDNLDPRAQSAQLKGTGARAVAAQQNAWEALAVFTAALAAAFFAGVDVASLRAPALLFVAARVAHPIFYLNGLGAPRSLAFAVGLAACVWIFVKALAA